MSREKWLLSLARARVWFLYLPFLSSLPFSNPLPSSLPSLPIPPSPTPTHVSPKSGINLALATLLLSKGCNIVIADLGLQPAASKLLLEYSESSNPKCFFHPTDVTSWPALMEMFDFALECFPEGIDILVPGAGGRFVGLVWGCLSAFLMLGNLLYRKLKLMLLCFFLFFFYTFSSTYNFSTPISPPPADKTSH